MKNEHIPIELDVYGSAGLVRQEGFPGESLSDLIAHRPEAWRFLRLARIVGAANAFAEQEIGKQEAKALVNAMVSISDYKGDFGVIWRLPTRNQGYEDIVERALKLMDEGDSLHALETD